MSRRGENIYRRKDGRWEGRYIKGYRLNGSTIYGSVYASKYIDCKEKLRIEKLKYVAGGIDLKVCGSGYFSDFFVYWLYSIAKPVIKDSTFSNYLSVSEKWILPTLGGKKLCKLDTETVQQFINGLSSQGLSAGSIKNIFHILLSAMKKAAFYNYLRHNPCDGVILPNLDRREVRALSIKDQKRLECTASQDDRGFAILLAMYTGLRIGEICALKWCDVDLSSGIIYISRTRQRIRNIESDADSRTTLITGSTKSQNSNRTIPLPQCITELFRRYEALSRSEYVFSHNSKPLEPRILQYYFKVLLKKAGLTTTNFHTLRHTFATRCLELCIDVKTLSEILGHASAKLTLDKYGHSHFTHKQAAMGTLDQLFDVSA